MFPFYTPWKQRIFGFLVLSGGFNRIVGKKWVEDEQLTLNPSPQLTSQLHKMVKHTRQQSANCLSVFDHFVGLEPGRLEYQKHGTLSLKFTCNP